MAEELVRAGWGIVAWDFRGHGGSDRPPVPIDWWGFGRDVLAVAETVPVPRIGVGHSAGGAALAMAEIERPGTFAALVLVEPILFPPPYGRMEDHPRALGADRRRDSFPSREALREHFADKEVFAGWDRRAFDGYLAGGFREEDGQVRLACPAHVEAEVYRTAGTHGAWERLGEVGVPVLILGGKESDSHPPSFPERLAGRFPRAAWEVVPGAGHLLPMERPDVVAGRTVAFSAPFLEGGPG